jgi:hypothetical protein
MKARQTASSYTRLAGDSFLMILQNMQAAIWDSSSQAKE